MPFGFLQVNSTSELTRENFTSLKRYAPTINKLVESYNLLVRCEEKLIVSNISAKGFGIIFRERRNIRFFKDGALVTLEVMFPNDTRASVLARVKHITAQENKSISIGFEIVEMDALSEVYYQEFLQELLNARGQA